jgi:sigma-B regulation protein RsbU (phosphoserine phosphatase)
VRPRAITRLAFIGSLICWFVLVYSDILVVFSDIKGLTPDVPLWLPRVMLDLYILCLYYFYKFRIERDETLNFTDLLWKVFATGLIATISSLALRLLVGLLGNTKLPQNVLFGDFIYQINLALLISFMMAAFMAWKRLILYQKSKWLIRLWAFFELLLIVVVIYDSITIPLSSTAVLLLDILLGLVIIVLSANMKWVAYLNFRQKWTSLLLLVLVMFYIGYFTFTADRLSDVIAARSTAFFAFQSHLFNISLIGFVLLYSVFSFLVILFNLPTSSVFEQKLEEVVNFQRISQSIQTEQSEESVYKILLESSVRAVFADAAWLEIESNSHQHQLYVYHITEQEARTIRDHLEARGQSVSKQSREKIHDFSRNLSSLKGAKYRSLEAFPITVKGKAIGTLAILKELPEGFNMEMKRIVAAFANQAGISIENFRLMEEAFQNERYQEELKIAKAVQKSLLPEKLECDAHFEVVAFSESADEVGGDYYDTLRINDHTVVMIIADVSGKGTTAAFHMSQMKGIFHSLSQQPGITPAHFMTQANRALVYCLERGSFITAIYFMIDTKARTVQYARAGHCPLLYFDAAHATARFCEDKGTALGMVRSRDYEKYIHTYTLPYHRGDMLVLFTDGITEARNAAGEEFGYDRLKAAVENISFESLKDMQQHLLRQLYEYTGSDEINDDYTTMIVRFKPIGT